MADASVRPARPADAADIARIQVETWRVGYRTILPEPVLAGLDVEAAQQSWYDALSTPPTPRHRVLVALEQDWVVGFVALAPTDASEPDGARADTVGFGPLLVEPRWGRRGHGSRLLAAAVDTSRPDGVTRVIAWIPEADAASRTFFGSAGWAADGYVRAFDTGAGELREVRIQVSLEQG